VVSPAAQTNTGTISDADQFDPITANNTASATVTALNTPGVAQNDAFTTAENAVLNGVSNVFADNGSGPDSDPDDPLQVTAVNGNALSVGTTITLASGALLTLNGNGTLSYDPNGAFDALPTLASGASNTPGHDSFTYTITGSSTATVTVTITGVDSDDTLIGTGGIDNFSGGIGNDLYFVGNTGDGVNEAVGAGYDIVAATVDYTLPANVEALYIIGTGLIGTGSGDANTLLSTGGANTLVGLAGDEIYYVNNSADTVTETGGAGYDIVAASVDYTLPANVEALYMIGAGLTGIGSGNADSLLSSGGPNTLIGLGGDDLYYVNNILDTVTETGGAGYDIVAASVD
jgi:VCBS repeat-containing protein